MEVSGINVEFLSINSKAYDVSALMLGLGQEIKMTVPLLPEDVKWFADNDKVLNIIAEGNEALITAESPGESIILIQDSTFRILKKIMIEVITEQAITLGLKASSPILK